MTQIERIQEFHMKTSPFKIVLGCLALSVSLAATGEDIELFTGTRLADPPNVMLVLDNSSNFSANVSTMRCSISPQGVVDTSGAGAHATELDGKAAAVEQCALYSAIKALDVSEGTVVNIGVMGFNANGLKQFNPATNSFSNVCRVNNASIGGCLLMPLTPLNAANKPNILEWIRNWRADSSTDYGVAGNNKANGAAMQETWAYFKGKTGISGRNYAGMVQGSECANNYVIFVGNAYTNNSTPADGTSDKESPRLPLIGQSDVAKNANPVAEDVHKSIFTDTISTICGTSTLKEDEKNGIYALNWARYMKDQEITTYSIAVLKPKAAGNPVCNAEYAAHMAKLGSTEVGGGKYFPTTDFEELQVAVGTALSEILSVNSAFASVSLPVSVNTQGTYLNQVYIGMFRPAQYFLPRWAGNLKQYRMGFMGSELKLLDARETPTSAISASGSGFIAECALSYWTPDVGTDPDYWNFKTANCSPYGAAKDSPDGNIVEKGAQGFKLRSLAPSDREVKTCASSTCNSLDDFDTNSGLASKTLLGNPAMSDQERADLINWAKGVNNKTLIDEDNFRPQVQMRPSVHGDVVHSRPVALNFGSAEDPEVVVFYGGNDGMLRAVNGNRDGGAELWSFIPPEFFPEISRLRDNEIPVSYKDSPVPITLPKPYGFDGPIGAYLEGTSTVTKAMIYPTMRRGGAALYGFDVTNPNNPDLRWRRTGTDLPGLGQTWSTPRVMKTAGHTNPMIIMGGGYDTCEDHDSSNLAAVNPPPANHNCSGTSKGNHIYVLDAITGALLNTGNTALPSGSAVNRGVIGDVTVVADPLTGIAKFAYAADLGGNIYRISGANANTPFGSTAPSGWTITKIASLGCADASSTCNPNRKFMFAPDVVEDQGGYYLMIGSGDREKPLYSYTGAASVDNYFFVIKDEPTNGGWLGTGTCAGVICMSSLGTLTASTSGVTGTPTAKGWKLALHDNEQVVTSAITLYGTVTFSTHEPTPAVTCGGANLGTARVYNVKYIDGSSANGRVAAPFEKIVGGGLPPSPVAGRVTLDDGATVPFVIGANPLSPLESVLGGGGLTPAVNEPKSRVYWYIQQ
jgi:type IV pilus assembly protein PilY1